MLDFKRVFSIIILTSILVISGFSKIQTSNASECISLTYGLSQGMSDNTTGGQVTKLQSFLSSFNYLTKSPSGYFGPLTKQAVKDLQSANGIEATGFVGPITRARIGRTTCGEGYVSPTTVTNTSSNTTTTTTTTANNNTSTNQNITSNVNGCLAGGKFNIFTGQTCVSNTNGDNLLLNLSSTVNTYDDNSSRISYAIANKESSSSYQFSTTCPSGVTATYNSVSTCNGGIRLPYGIDNFSIQVYKNSLKSVSIISKLSAINSYGTVSAEDTDTAVIYGTESTDNTDNTTSNSSLVNLTFPTKNKSFYKGDTIKIKWDAPKKISDVRIEYRKGSGSYVTISSSAQNSGAYTWVIPQSLVVGSDYRIRIADAEDTGNNDISVSFEVKESTLTAKSITAFNISSPSATGVIDEVNKTIKLTLPFGSTVGSYAPSITVTPNATVTPASGVTQNFTSPKDYVVKAENGNTQTYRVTVVADKGSSDKLLTSFSFANPNVTGTIDQSAKSVSVTVPVGTSLASLTPTIGISANATISPASGVAQKFTSPKVYTVKAQDGTTQAYTVTVTTAPKSSAKAITSFDFSSLNVHGVINDSVTPKTITVTVPKGTSKTALTPTIGISANATISPKSGVAGNFTNPKDYTVKAQDGSSNVYRVTVVVASSI
jgi:peptidoglycan hydrolase-like protein with peptidoglycan-binding domain